MEIPSATTSTNSISDFIQTAKSKLPAPSAQNFFYNTQPANHKVYNKLIL